VTRVPREHRRRGCRESQRYRLHRHISSPCATCSHATAMIHAAHTPWVGRRWRRRCARTRRMMPTAAHSRRAG